MVSHFLYIQLVAMLAYKGWALQICEEFLRTSTLETFPKTIADPLLRWLLVHPP
jgi:hypothetical protein